MTEESKAIREKLAVISEQEGYHITYDATILYLMFEEKYRRCCTDLTLPQDHSEEDADFSKYDAELEQQAVDLFNSLRESERSMEEEERNAYLKHKAHEAEMKNLHGDGGYRPAVYPPLDDRLETERVFSKLGAKVEAANKTSETEKDRRCWQHILESPKDVFRYSEDCLAWAKRTACERLGLEESCAECPELPELQPLKEKPYPTANSRSEAMPKCPASAPIPSFRPAVVRFLLAAAVGALGIYLSSLGQAGKYTALLLCLVPFLILLAKGTITANRIFNEKDEIEFENKKSKKQHAEAMEAYEQENRRRQEANAAVESENEQIRKKNEEIKQYRDTVFPEKLRTYCLVLKAARKALWEELQKLKGVLEENYRDFLPEKCQDKESVDGLLDIFDYGRAETLPEALRLLYDDRKKQQAGTP